MHHVEIEIDKCRLTRPDELDGNVQRNRHNILEAKRKERVYFRYSRSKGIGTHVMRAKAKVTRPLMDGLSPEVFAPYNQGAPLG